MGILTKDAILGADDLKIEAVNVPEWGGEVNVRSMTGVERDDFEASIVSIKGKDEKANLRNFRAKLVALCVVDQDGKRMFSEKDIPALGQKNAAALDRVFTKAQEMSGLRKEDVNELTKNSEATSGDDSPTD
jgi:hypothetical protein